MPLTYPPSPGINIFCCAGKHFKNTSPIFPFINTSQDFGKEQFRTENKQKRTRSASWDIARISDLTIQSFVIDHNLKLKSGFNLF